MGGQGSKNFQTKAKIEAAGSQGRGAFLPCQTPLLGLSGDRGSRRKLVTQGPHVLDPARVSTSCAHMSSRTEEGVSTRPAPQWPPRCNRWNGGHYLLLEGVAVRRKGTHEF